MPPAAVAFLVVSGLIHVLWNVLIKRSTDATLLFTGGIVLALAAYTPVYFIWIHGSFAAPPAGVLPVIALTGLAEGVYLILLTYTYGRADLSLVYPVSRGSSPVFIVLAGMLWLNEQPVALGIAGVAVIIAGVLAVAWPGAGVHVTKTSVVLSLLTGSAIAAHHVGYKWLFAYYPPQAAIYVVWLVTGATIATYALATRGFAAAGRFVLPNLRLMALVGACSLGGFLLALLALNMTLVAYVGAARNIGIVFCVFLGNRLLGEGGLGRRLLGAAAITAGIVLISLA